MKDFGSLYEELDERVLLGFGGVSEYGITVRWDKNFLTLLYITLARKPLFRVYGGIRFGGTMTVEDAWKLGFDHVALAAGAGRPTIIDIKNNLSKGIRKASDFLMALQLTGAYKRSSIANLQVQLPAIVIGGGLTAIDTATELLAYYPIQIEKVAERVHSLVAAQGVDAVRAMFDEEEWNELEIQLAHAKELEEERALAAKEARDPKLQPLLDKWGGVWLVYRRSVLESPAYRLNHEEVQKSAGRGRPLRREPLADGGRARQVRPREGAEVPTRPRADRERRRHAARKRSSSRVRTICVAAGTSPNTMYEKEYEGTFQLDAKKQYFQAFDGGGAHRSTTGRRRRRSSRATTTPSTTASRSTATTIRSMRAVSSRRWRARSTAFLHVGAAFPGGRVARRPRSSPRATRGWRRSSPTSMTPSLHASSR